MRQDNDNRQDPTPKKSFSDWKSWALAHKFLAFVVIVLVACTLNFAYSMIQNLVPSNETDITVDQFKAALADNKIENITYNVVDQDAYGYWITDGGEEEPWVMAYSLAGSDKLKEMLSDYPSVKFETVMVSRHAMTSSQTALLATIFICVIILMIARETSKEGGENFSGLSEEGRAFGFGGNKGTHGEKRSMQASQIPQVHFDDVKGCDEALDEIKEIQEFLEESDKYAKLGAKTPHGILLAGSPGTGKTYMAKALAYESGASFFFISGSDFMEMFVGVGAQRVRQLFASARKAAPSIVFIDEIDAIGKKRAATSQMGDGEADRTLNQLLVEMDGFSATDNVIVIAATNRIDTLDPALLRPGRFDRHILVDLPDKAGRLAILKVHSQDKPVQAVDFEHYATITAGMSGADLANLMNEAAIFAARRNGLCITDADMNDAFERIVAGAEKKGRTLSESEKKTTAYHEAGHAIVGHMLEGADKVSKISIVSRGQALGYTLTLPEMDKHLQTRSQLKDKLAMFLGGLVAEEMINGDDISTGPSNDLERATKTAYSMVTRFGMSDELGRRAFLEDETGYKRAYSEQKGVEIDRAVDELMKEAHDTARRILDEFRERLDQIAAVLVEYEVVEGEEMEDLLNGCWRGHASYSKAKSAEEMEHEFVERNGGVVPYVPDEVEIPDDVEVEPVPRGGLREVWRRYREYKPAV